MHWSIMIIRAIKDLTNSRLAGEQLTYSQLLPYFDAVVDEVNARLHTQFKVFSEITSNDITLEYNEFPGKYIRTVVCVGAAYKWYIDDEEGIATADALGQEYQNNLFLMERDYGPLIPTDKRRDDKGGFFCDHNGNPNQENFWNPDLRYIEQGGYAGTSVTDLKIKEIDGARHLIATLTDQRFGSKNVDCGIVSPNVTAFQLDVEGNIIALMSDGTVYKVGANLYVLIIETLERINPVVSIAYNGKQFVATRLDGTQEVVGELYHPDNAQNIFTTVDHNITPENHRDGDIWFKIEEV